MTRAQMTRAQMTRAQMPGPPLKQHRVTRGRGTRPPGRRPPPPRRPLIRTTVKRARSPSCAPAMQPSPPCPPKGANCCPLATGPRRHPNPNPQ
ncbi:hypothetical protein [Paracoccus sp. (in: a-proteobacteria)]|uniref:hypothetical protein n=1 Tax=Paracoccus sp. TaxID=267 RepID=UPI003A899294